MHFKVSPSISLLIALLAFLGNDSVFAQDAASPLGLAIAIDTVIATNPTDCTVSDGTIDIDIINDQAAAIFSIDAGTTWHSDSLFTNLPTGDYEIAVAYPDTFGVVFYPTMITLINPDAPILNSVNYNLPNDCAAALGLIVIDADSTQNLIYSIDNSTWQEEGAFFDVPAGLYTIAVANAVDTGCIQYWSGNPLDFPFNLPPTFIGVIPTSPSDCGGADGSLQALVNPGSGTPEYSIDGINWFATSLFPNLAAGAVDLYVRNDDGSCEVAYSGNPVTISDPATANIDSVLAVQPASCGETTGALTIYASGGEAPLEYSINGTDWQADSVFQNLPVGNYFPQVANAGGGCQAQDASLLLESAVDNCPDIIAFSMVGGTTHNVCLDTLVGLQSQITSAGDCTTDPSEITMTVDQNTACVDLDAAVGFFGSDTLCVFHCDGGIPQICDTTFLVVRVLPPTDTMYLTMDAGTTNQYCLDSTFLQHEDGNLTTSDFCDAGMATEVMASNATNNCFTLTADPNFGGQAPMVCVVHCYDFSLAFCDTTYVSVMVNPTVVNNCTPLYQGATIQQTMAACGVQSYWCSDLPMDTLTALNVYKKGVNINAQAVACATDPQYFSLPLEEGSNTFVFENTVDNCMDTVTVELSSPLVPYSGATSFEIECDAQQTVCLSIPFSNLGDYSISVNGNAASTNGCTPYTFYNYSYASIPGGGFTGPYSIDNWTVNGIDYTGQFDKLTELVAAMNTWNPAGNWMLNTNGNFIYGGTTADTYGNAITVTRLSDNSTGVIVLSEATGFENVAVSLGVGSHSLLVVHNPTGCTDQFDVTVTCVMEPICEEDFLGADVDLELEDCANSYSVCTGIDFADWSNYDFLVNGSPFTGALDTCIGEKVGISLTIGMYELIANRIDIVCSDTLQVELSCDDGSCKEIFTNTIDYITLDDCNEMGEYCLPIGLDDNPQFQFRLNGALYKQDWFDCGAGRSSIFLGMGEHNLSIYNTVSNCEDEVIVNVSCNPPAVETVLNVEWNSTDTICINNVNLSGPIESIWNDCPDASGEVALVEFLSDNCFAITGVEPGEEEACIIQCDSLGNCETTILTIVVNGIGLPDAQDDTFMATEMEELTADLLVNDTLNGILDSIYLVTQPTYGSAFIDGNGSLLYLPSVDTCEAGLVDTLSYAICNTSGCDTASIFITVICDVPETVSGFSPNGDGINDAFVIAGLEDYPNHQLLIYNRWGAQILKVSDYQNDWEGTWDGADLPDGTYYYLLDMGNGMSTTGWVQIKR